MKFEKIFDESYERVLAMNKNGRTFFDSFYDNFVGSSQLVAEQFRHTDMEGQKAALKKAFYSLLAFYATNHADDYLEKTAERHSKRGLDIKPELYDLWLENLIKTAKEFDPMFDDDVELSWRLVLCAGITYMKFKYDR